MIGGITLKLWERYAVSVIFFSRNPGVFELQAQIKINNTVINKKESDGFFSFINIIFIKNILSNIKRIRRIISWFYLNMMILHYLSYFDIFFFNLDRVFIFNMLI